MPRGERALIGRLRRAAAAGPKAAPGQTGVRLGIGDDCAIVRPGPRDEIVVTTDLFLEQVHFRRDWHLPEVAGHRCLARGLSDVAAMGARPVAAFLSFALPPELAGEWAERFADGLLRLARRHGVVLAGGDTAQAPGARQGAQNAARFTADIVLLGSVARGKALVRSGAQPGDGIYVTGALGGAAAELALLSRAPARFAHLNRARAAHPHLYPVPRLGVGTALLGRASAAMDLSDGLSTDLAHLCEASGVAAEVEAALLPIHALARNKPPAGKTPLEVALDGGEDYELLFTAAAGRRLGTMIAGAAVHRIGTILTPARGRPRVVLLGEDGRRSALRPGGWEHFRTRV